MVPADLQPVIAHELTAVAAIELPPPEDASTQQALPVAPKAAAAAAPIAAMQVADSHEPVATWTPIPRDPSRSVADYNPAVY